MLAADFLVFSSILSAAWCQSGMKVVVPKTLNATSSSCLLIPCQFTIPKEKEVFLTHSPVVTWRKGSLWLLYDTDNFTNAERQKEPQMKVVGDLQKKNCTSVMMNLTSQHSDRYFFKFQSVGLTIVETKAVSIHVSEVRGIHSLPGSYTLSIANFQTCFQTISPIDSLAEPHVVVPVFRLGEVGNLTCTVPAPCPSNSPNVTWDPALDGNITQWTHVNADGTHSVSAILNFVPSFHHHELKVNCVSINLLDREDKPLFSHKTVILNVEYSPKETLISVTGSVWSSNNLTLTCQSDANPPAAHRWFVKKEGIVEEVGSSHVLSLSVAHENSGEYICEAQNLHGAVNSTTLQINVPDTSLVALFTVLALFSMVISLVLIYRSKCRGKKPNRSEMKQDEDIYVNVSSSAEKSHQFQSKTCGYTDANTFNPEQTFNKNLSNKNIYGNY